ncbi:hypothetical protein COF09_29215 [Bacillus toyonensis]|nr:hypothetical protein COF09_29215 [Bacillus toyonensis]
MKQERDMIPLWIFMFHTLNIEKLLSYQGQKGFQKNLYLNSTKHSRSIFSYFRQKGHDTAMDIHVSYLEYRKTPFVSRVEGI